MVFTLFLFGFLFLEQSDEIFEEENLVCDVIFRVLIGTELALEKLHQQFSGFHSGGSEQALDSIQSPSYWIFLENCLLFWHRPSFRHFLHQTRMQR